ncbi:uncharacterized protein LAJ45_08247 [Morchella importuna]|uniref:uncharacterized protein n=1 Tax=Morchella importuna TaxID=1174673 RepID=UPI001E8EC275|nr:uncharacterized protein LAJ45_08247 [Morchella importuna]KAH8147781.1 hypothetical protein LAJ45_08247 [Morchella importuna]
METIKNSSEPKPFLLSQEQTYLARIRYGAQVAEPPCPPKLLPISIDPLPMFCRASFTPLSLLTEHINVDVDSECGMQLDISHQPGIFDGSNKPIAALSHINVHPTDRLLLRTTDLLSKNNPISALGRKSTSFLRRTEYISADGPQYAHVSAFARTQRLAMAKLVTLRSHDEEYQEPTRILKAILRGFDTANPETPRETPEFEEDDEFAVQAEHRWKPIESMKHPDRLGVVAVEEFPVLPDPEACSDTGGFMVFSFQTSPVPPAPHRDFRLDVGIIIPHDQHNEEGTVQTFDYYLPTTQHAALNTKRSFDDYNVDIDYKSSSSEGIEKTLPYKFVRTYETRVQKQVTDRMAVILHQGDEKKPKAAYYYPIDAKVVLQPARGAKLLERPEPVERLNVSVRELDNEENQRREAIKRVRMGL